MLSRLFPSPSVVTLAGRTFEVREVTFGDLAYFEHWATDALGDPLARVKLIEDREERLKELYTLYYIYEDGQDIECNELISQAVYGTVQGQAVIISRMTTLTYDEALDLNATVSHDERAWLFGLFSSQDAGKRVSAFVDRELGLPDEWFEAGGESSLSRLAMILAHEYHYPPDVIAGMTIGQANELFRYFEKVRCIDRDPTSHRAEVYRKRSREFHRKYRPKPAGKPTNGQHSGVEA